MFEMLLCSLLTIFPDYMFRRYVQGKRIGKEITFYSMWFELRWGITACVILTVGLITLIFYNHPSTTSATLLFRTVPILPETMAVWPKSTWVPAVPSRKGAPISGWTARSRRPRWRRRAARSRGRGDPGGRKSRYSKADGQLQQAKSAHQQALDELETKKELHRRNPGIVPVPRHREARVRVQATEGQVAAASAAKDAAEIRSSTVLPAEKASAEAALAHAQVELDKTVIRAGVSGRVEQFFLRVGDIVNPLMRPAGVLIPEGAGQRPCKLASGRSKRRS